METNGNGKQSVAIELVKPSSMAEAYIPHNYEDAMRMSETLAKSGMTGPLKSAEQVFLVLATGAEMGFSPTASLRGFFVFSGKVCPYADTIVAQCLRSPHCEYFICVESTAERAVYETKRKGSPSPQRNGFTMEEAKAAGLSGKDVWKAYPRDMLRHRAAAPLARMVYPDVVLGLQSLEEMRDAPILTNDPPPRPQEVIDADVVTPPAKEEDSITKITAAFLDVQTIDECDALAARVAKLGLAEDSDDRKALLQLYKETARRVKAAK